MFTATSVHGWYAEELVKPAWTPSGSVIGSVWTVLYALMAVSAWLVWIQGGFKAHARPLGLFVGQLCLNAAWSALFFGLKRPDLAAVDIAFLWCAVLFTCFTFFKVSRPAGALLVPYSLWLTFAAILNFSIVRLN
jgi:tryptophan-rich sensory protein